MPVVKDSTTHIDDLIAKSTASLAFLRQHTKRGSVKLDIDDRPDAREMLVQVSRDWVGITVYNQAGRGMEKLSRAVYEGVK